MSLLTLLLILLNCVSFSELKEDNIFKCSNEKFAEHFNCTDNICEYGKEEDINCSVATSVQCEVTVERYILV